MSVLKFSVALIIIAANINRQKTVLEIAEENPIIIAVRMLSNTGPCLSFYLFTMTKLVSRLFGNKNQSGDGQAPTVSTDIMVK